MPETRAERVLFSLGIAIIGVLLAVIFLGRTTSEGASPATPTTAQSKTVHVTSTLHQSTTPTTTTAPPTSTVAPGTGTTTAAQPTTTRPETRLQVTARDDTWLSIRGGSSSGPVLFEGTLAKGDTRTYTASQFHVRFGAAANVAATLNGKPLALPGGTYSATIGPSGLGSRSA